MNDARDGNIHAGHRQRVRERFKAEGLEHFNEINALEMLLFYCRAKGDTNPLAHRLLNRFGSLQGVLRATYAELRGVPDVGDYTATYLCFIAELNRRCALPDAEKNLLPILSTAAAKAYVIPYFLTDRDEAVRAVFLDNAKKPIRCELINRGVVNASEISTRRLAELALECKATAVILAHNHPGGMLTPSEADIATTSRLRRALAGIGIELCDHIIVAGKEACSLAELGKIQ